MCIRDSRHRDRHRVSRRPLDLPDRLGDEVLDRLLFGPHVAVAVVGERGRDREDDRPDLQGDEEEEAWEEVLQRDVPGGAVDREHTPVSYKHLDEYKRQPDSEEVRDD